MPEAFGDVSGTGKADLRGRIGCRRSGSVTYSPPFWT